MRLDTWVSYDVAYGQPLPWRCTPLASLLVWLGWTIDITVRGKVCFPPSRWNIASRVFFFLPAIGRCCPLVSAHPANCIRFSSNIAIADHFPSKTFSFEHHLSGAGEAWPANSTFSFKHHLSLTGEAWPACRAILPFHSNTT